MALFQPVFSCVSAILDGGWKLHGLLEKLVVSVKGGLDLFPVSDRRVAPFTVLQTKLADFLQPLPSQEFLSNPPPPQPSSISDKPIYGLHLLEK